MEFSKAVLLGLVLLQSGCSFWTQKSDTVLIREPKDTSYSVHNDLGKIAREYWRYSALAANAYQLAWPTYEKKLEVANDKSQLPPLGEQFELACRDNSKNMLPTPGWYAWENFPNEDLLKRAEDAKLFFSVWERRTKSGKVAEIAIVFRGTEGDQRQDWFSNLRWFIPTRFRGEDQYDITRFWVSRAFEAELQERMRRNEVPEDVKIVAIGHSLGGGLAQQLAYALPRNAYHPIRVGKVVALNSSPVTGWYTTDNPPRDENTRGLKIDRVFEHGEALAYIRLSINLVFPPYKSASDVRDLRFNLEETAGGFINHQIQFFACRLAEKAGATQGVIHTENFNSDEVAAADAEEEQ